MNEKLNSQSKVSQKDGNSPILVEGRNSNYAIIDFWKWNQSDLLNNATRGKLAEFLVSMALDIDLTEVPEFWNAYDIETKNGLRIEVKSAAYIQSWNQTNYSKISFKINPTKSWDEVSNKYQGEVKRQSDYYIFCLLKHKDVRTINPLDTDQWEFYLMPTSVLNEILPNQNSISLSRLLKIKPTICSYTELKKQVYSFN